MPWDSLVRLYFVDLCSLYMIGTTTCLSLSLFVYYTTCNILYTWYMIGTTIHSYFHSYIYIPIYILYFVCLSFVFQTSSSLKAWTMTVVAPGPWWLWPKALGHDAGTTTAAAVGGDRLRFSHHKMSQQIAYWKIGGPGCT